MAGTATPPPAPPAAPPSSTPPPSAPATPPGGASSVPPTAPQLDDPNLAMSRLVSQSREKNEKGAPATPPPPATPTTPATPPAAGAPATPPATPPAEPPKLTSLLQQSMRYGLKGPPKPPGTPDGTPAPPATPPAPPATPAAAATTPPAPAKPKRPVKKTPPATLDPAAITAAASAAATEAAMRAIETVRPTQPSPADSLTAEDRHDYEVAQHMAKMDPRFKDAPQIILDQVRQAEEYAARWEAANPGKAFDVRDEEHNEFYEGMQRPWQDFEYREAEDSMRQTKRDAERDAKTNERMAALEADNARLELSPTVNQRFDAVVGELSQMVGDDVIKTLNTGGWDALHNADPVTAQVLGAALQEFHPFVEAAIQIDDPRARIRIDLRNPAHQQWNTVVHKGEASLVGTQDEAGRMFAKRADYVRMKPAQQAQHWFLTTDMIIQGAMEYAAEQVKTISQQQKDRLAKLGYVRQPVAPAAGNGTVTAPIQGAAPSTPAPSGGNQPVSPTVGSGAKIDDTGGAPRTGEAALWREISKNLFGR